MRKRKDAEIMDFATGELFEQIGSLLQREDALQKHVKSINDTIDAKVAQAIQRAPGKVAPRVAQSGKLVSRLSGRTKALLAKYEMQEASPWSGTFDAADKLYYTSSAALRLSRIVRAFCHALLCSAITMLRGDGSGLKDPTAWGFVLMSFVSLMMTQYTDVTHDLALLAATYEPRSTLMALIMRGVRRVLDRTSGFVYSACLTIVGSWLTGDSSQVVTLGSWAFGNEISGAIRRFHQPIRELVTLGYVAMDSGLEKNEVLLAIIGIALRAWCATPVDSRAKQGDRGRRACRFIGSLLAMKGAISGVKDSYMMARTLLFSGPGSAPKAAWCFIMLDRQAREVRKHAMKLDASSGLLSHDTLSWDAVRTATRAVVRRTQQQYGRTLTAEEKSQILELSRRLFTYWSDAHSAFDTSRSV